MSVCVCFWLSTNILRTHQQDPPTIYFVMRNNRGVLGHLVVMIQVRVTSWAWGWGVGVLTKIEIPPADIVREVPRATARLDTLLLLHSFSTWNLSFYARRPAKMQRNAVSELHFRLRLIKKREYISWDVIIWKTHSSQPWIPPQINLNFYKLMMSLFWPEQQFDQPESCCQLVL